MKIWLNLLALIRKVYLRETKIDISTAKVFLALHLKKIVLIFVIQRSIFGDEFKPEKI